MTDDRISFQMSRSYGLTNTLFISLGVLLGLLILVSNYVSYFLIIGLPVGFLAILVMPDCYSKAKHLCSELRWWHGLWVLMLLSGLVFRIRDTSTLADSPLDAWALFRIGLMTLIGVAGTRNSRCARAAAE